MSTVDAKKFEEVAASFSQTFSVFTAGALSIGDGMLVSNGVSQLNQLDEYINSTGKTTDEEESDPENILQAVEAQKLQESAELAEKVSEAINEAGMDDLIEMSYTSQYVQLTLNGALLLNQLVLICPRMPSQFLIMLE